MGHLGSWLPPAGLSLSRLCLSVDVLCQVSVGPSHEGSHGGCQLPVNRAHSGPSDSDAVPGDVPAVRLWPMANGHSHSWAGCGGWTLREVWAGPCREAGHRKQDRDQQDKDAPAGSPLISVLLISSKSPDFRHVLGVSNRPRDDAHVVGLTQHLHP